MDVSGAGSFSPCPLPMPYGAMSPFVAALGHGKASVHGGAADCKNPYTGCNKRDVLLVFINNSLTNGYIVDNFFMEHA